MINFYAELARKLIHLSSLWISLLYFYTSKELMLLILVPLAFLSLYIDFSRRLFSSFNIFINKLLGFMMREEEKDKFALVGATYLLISAVLTIFLFNKEIAIFSLSVLSISDSCAALVGKRFGKTKLIGNKTLEGSLAFFVSAALVGIILVKLCYFSLSLEQIFLAVLLATLVELLAKKIHIDDNFTVPLVIGLVLSL